MLDLLPFVQFEKREKHPWRNTFEKKIIDLKVSIKEKLEARTFWVQLKEKSKSSNSYSDNVLAFFSKGVGSFNIIAFSLFFIQ